MSKILHALMQDKIEELQSSLDAVGAEAKALSKQNTATEQELQVCPHGSFLCSSGCACSLLMFSKHWIKRIPPGHVPCLLYAPMLCIQCAAEVIIAGLAEACAG